MKILITGGTGFLGSRLVRSLNNRAEVFAPSHHELDITDRECVRHIIDRHHPHVVIHCAAISSTAYCQEHPDESYAINVMGAVNVAYACRETGARLIYCSSDQVYVLSEYARPRSTEEIITPAAGEDHIYGRHKLDMENRVAAVMPSAVGLRLSWMYDANDARHHDIINVIRRTIDEKVALKASSNEMRGMTDVGRVVRGINTLIFDTPNVIGGIYNFGSPNSLDTFHLLCNVLTPFTSLLLEETTWQRNLAMDTTPISKYGIVFPDTLSDLQAAICG